MSRPPNTRPSDLSTIAEERSNASTSTTTGATGQRQRSHSRASALSLSEEPSSWISQLTDPTIGYGGPPSSTPLDHTLLTHTGALPPLILEERGEEDSYFHSAISPTAGKFQGAGISPVAEDQDSTTATPAALNKHRKHGWIRAGAVLALMFIAGVVAGVVVSSQGGDSSSSLVTPGDDESGLAPPPPAVATPTVAPSTIGVSNIPSAVPTIHPTPFVHETTPAVPLPDDMNFPLPTIPEGEIGGGGNDDDLAQMCAEESPYYASYEVYWGVAVYPRTNMDCTLSEQPLMQAGCTNGGKAVRLDSNRHDEDNNIHCYDNPHNDKQVLCQGRSTLGPNMVRVGCCGASPQGVKLIVTIPPDRNATCSSTATGTSISILEDHEDSHLQQQTEETPPPRLYSLATMRCADSDSNVECPESSLYTTNTGNSVCGRDIEMRHCEPLTTTTANCTIPLPRIRARAVGGQCVGQRMPS